MKTKANFIGVIVALSLLTLQGCVKTDIWPGITGRGPMVIDTYQVSNFDGIQIDVNAHVNIYQANEFKLEIQGQRNILDILDVSIINNVLVIRYDKEVVRHERMQIEICVPNLRLISSFGSADIRMMTPLVTSHLALDVFGSGSFTVNGLSAYLVNSRIQGSGNINLKGTAKIQSVNINGSGNYNAYDLITEESNINVFGSGHTYIYVSKSLDASIYGSGNIYFKGDPPYNRTSVFGSGKLIRVF